MATQIIGVRTGERNLENEGWIKTVRTIERFREEGAGFFSRMVNTFWRASCGLSLAGFLLPHEPASKPGNSLSPMEKARLEGYQQMYLGLY